MNVDAPETRNDFDALFSPGRFLLMLGLLVLISYPGPILGRTALCYRDAGLFSYPVAYYLREAFWQGHWPLWNPYSQCGTPFLAQWNVLALYPPSLIYILLPMPWALNCFLLGHLLLGGAGMYRLAQHWFENRFAACVAGLVFAWNGLSIHCLMWPCHTAGLAWMPWVVWQCDRASREGGRRVYWAALAGACQMLTGSPETILLTWLILAGVLLHDVLQKRNGFWRGGLRLLGVVATASALSAVQLLPWLDLLAHGDRTSATGNGFWAMPPWGLANFLVPLFHTSGSRSGVFMQDEQQWTSSYYIGVLPLALAAVALWRARPGRTLLLALLALAGVLLALGDPGLVLNILKRPIPILGFIRFPIKFIILTEFSLALLAGAGAAWLQTQSFAAVRRSLSWPAAWIGLGILLVLGASYLFPFPDDAWNAIWPNALGRLVFLLAGVAVLTLVFKDGESRSRALLSFVFLVWMGLDICTHMPPQNPSVPVRAYDDDPPAMSRLPRIGQSRAMLDPGVERMMDHLVNTDLLALYLGQRAELFGDCNLLNQIPIVGGFMSLHLAQENKVAELLRSGKAAPGLLEYLGVSQITSAQGLFKWQARTNYMNWANVGQRPVFLDDDATLAALGQDGFQPRRIVYLPSSARGQVQAGEDGQARILSSRFEASQCVIRVSAAARTMLVVAQANYHCWQASVDGAPTTLWRANYAFQAVEVPAGEHEVRIVYVDWAFRIGAVISVLALLVSLRSLWK